MDKVALLVVYNHRFDRNIPKIDSLYQGKFSHVYHIIPFYDGDKENVIPVYESSYYFSGYIAQAYTHLRDKGFTHFFVVADDMLLNPAIDENSLWDVLGIGKNDCYIDDLIKFQERKQIWPRTWEAMSWRINPGGVEVEKILPPPEEAVKRFQEKGLPYTSLDFVKAWKSFKLFRKNLKEFYKFKRMFDYPLVGAYSDIFLVTADCMQDFCTYCGAFAATNLFVEIAIPTALVLSSNHIKYNKDVKLAGGAMWSDADMEFLKAYNNKLDELIKNYPSDKFYLHPIKLSKWK